MSVRPDVRVVMMMEATPSVENRRARKVLATEAGYRQVSGFSVLAGTLAAFGALTVLMVAAGGIATAIHGGSDFTDVSRNDLRVVTAVIVALAAFLAFCFGGYAAGRMARRSGSWNGFLVFVLGAVLLAAGSVWVWAAHGSHVVSDFLRNVGAPTTWHEWRNAGVFGGLGSLLAMLVGSVLGGSLGERWHTKLVTRAVDPAFGPNSNATAVTGEAPVAQHDRGQARSEQHAHVRASEDSPGTRDDRSRVERPVDAPASTSPGPDSSPAHPRRRGLFRRTSSLAANTER